MTATEWAAILATVAPIIIALTGLIVVFTKRNTTQENANKSAVAVSTVTETKNKVDILLDTMQIMQDQLTELKELREKDAQKMRELENELATERGAHAKTRRELDDVKGLLKTKDDQIAKLNAQIIELKKLKRDK